MKFISKPLQTAELCRLRRISESYLYYKNVKPSHFHDVIEIGNICFMLESKSFSDLCNGILFDKKTENLDFSCSILNVYCTYINIYTGTIFDVNVHFISVTKS